MTLIVGFRKENHDLLLSADSRITFKRSRARVDDLQKLYMPISEVAIGFAGQSVDEIQQAFKTFSERVRDDDFAQSEDSLWEYNDRILRVFRDEVSSIESLTRLIIGVAHSPRPEANILKLMWIKNEKIDQEVDIPPGEYRTAGSAFEERDDDYLESKIGQAFEVRDLPPQAPSIDINKHAAWLSTQYSLAWEKMRQSEASDQEEAEGLQTAGPILHTVISKGGHFLAFTTTIETVIESEGRVRIKSSYNAQEECFEIINCDTEQVTELCSVEKYSFNRSSADDDLFDVTMQSDLPS